MSRHSGILRAGTGLLAAIVIVLGAIGPATGQELARSGSWVAMVSGLEIGLEKGLVLYADDLCMAVTGNEKAQLAVVIGDRGSSAVVQICATAWNWRGIERDAALVFGGSTLTLQDALYWDACIDHITMAKNGGYSALEAIAGQPGNIQVHDYRGKLIATFPSNGFRAMLDRAIRCATDR